ncbi:MAG: FHA domain-containing protein [Gammaproteobacteria bacterium]|nr:FHA domain-containing protein [Gammaproteobacteria bacterium]
MYKLAIVHKGKVEKNIRLTAGTMVIGRKPECNIQLDEKMISGQHAEITIKPDEILLKDLGSTNGTLVNGQKVTGKTLKAGDQVSIGNYKLIFVREHGETEDPDATMVISSSDKTIPMSKPVEASNKKLSSGLFIVIGLVILILVGAGLLIVYQ